MTAQSWSSMTLQARLDALKFWVMPHGLLPLLEQDISIGLRAMEQHEVMPGPTGEYNGLYITPRGVFLVVQQEGDIGALRAMMARVLLAGNRLHVSSSVADRLQQELHSLAFQLPEGTVVMTSDEEVRTNHAGVIVAGSIADAQAYTQRVAALPGAIIPVLHACKNDVTVLDPHAVTQWVYERTQTINVTAIGGNASLLVLDDE